MVAPVKRSTAGGSCLHGSGQLVEAQVGGPADLEDLAAGRRVGDGPLDEVGHVIDRYEVDGVVAVAEDHWTTRPPGGLLKQVDPQLGERSGSDHCCRHTTG
jgi:hypothetical protein